MKSANHVFRVALGFGVAAVALVPALATAQEEAGGIANVSSEAPVSDDIVVTGTILRGAPPVGSNVVAVGQDRIASTGATTSNELLASVPQVSNLFNTVPTSRLAVAVNQIQVVRPNLRNLAGETSSSSSTLVLFDGHRIASVGVTQNAVDPDLIPTIAIERVEVVTDGGSATYGADAVGGVINFITRKRFDGSRSRLATASPTTTTRSMRGRSSARTGARGPSTLPTTTSTMTRSSAATGISFAT